MGLFSPPDPRRDVPPVGATLERARPWMDTAAVARALGAPAGPVLVVDDTAEIALRMLVVGYSVTLVPGPVGALAAFKVAALRHLQNQSVRAALGLDAAGRRVWFYHHLRPNLKTEHQKWWDGREAAVREGICHMGLVELAVARARSALRAFSAETGDLERLVQDPARQAKVGARMSGRRGLAFAALLQRLMPGLVPGPPRALRDRLAAPLNNGLLSDTPDLQYIIAGRSCGPAAQAAWLTPAGHGLASARLDQLTIIDGPIDAALAACEQGAYSAAVLGHSPRATAATWAHATRLVGRPGVVIGPATAAPASASPVSAGLLHAPPHLDTLP